MKSMLPPFAGALFAAALLSFSSIASAQHVVGGAKDCAKTSRPQICEAIKAADEACKGKAAGAEHKACVKEKLKEAGK